jgi:ABC-type sugar transport system substrate-binding protein
MRKLNMALLIILAAGCAKRVPVKPPEEIRAPGYTIIKLSEDKFFVAARKEVSKEALEAACNKVQYVCSTEMTGFLYEVERKRK